MRNFWEVRDRVVNGKSFKAFLNIALLVSLAVGFTGIIDWAAFICLWPLGKSGFADWFWDFTVGYPIVSIPLAGTSIFTIWFIGQMCKSVEPQDDI